MVGVKFRDQYQDARGQHWILVQASLICLLDVAESFVLSYQLKNSKLQDNPDSVYREIEQEIFTAKQVYTPSRASHLDYFGSTDQRVFRYNITEDSRASEFIVTTGTDDQGHN